ncbi:M6 family metalloprotease domain-containing protein [Streptomyces sp. ISL-11]|uniref:M6 family metalloprotease domain-containing protein n=1 Tax=Streptomyces sp. ISL-11 TaxID=2819174 RepID=UPI001BEB22FA|nr:M6 family metalloprotease domain-containing protein [Streptomyces sp. ISL-11]MBT2384670.1 M6 family metalloprotease domain-containing protein [Streptomyces sp. ISL-11]
MKFLAITVMVITTLALTSPVASQAEPGDEEEAAAGHTTATTDGRRPSGPCALRGIDDTVSEAADTPPGFTRSYGTVRALTLFVDFPDARAEDSPEERYDEFFPAVADYYRTSSYGRLDYRSTPVRRWIHMSRPYEAYGIERGTPFDPGSDEEGYHALSKEIVKAVDDTVDFRRFDLINVLVTPNAGPPATEDVQSVTFAGSPTGLGTKDGVPFKNVSFIWSRQTGDSPYRVLNHENAHSFGLPDLYYTRGGSGLLRTPVGHWDPMDEDWGPSNDFLAWHKWKLGWLAPDQVNCLATPGTRTLTLTPTSVTGGTKLAVVPLSRTRALTLEARAPGPLDHMVCRPGVLITTVATDVASGAGPVRTSDATPGSAGCYTTDLNVNARLSDATYVTGQRQSGSGVTVKVLGRDTGGNWRVTVRRAPRIPRPPVTDPASDDDPD